MLSSFSPPWGVLPHSKDRCSLRARGSSPRHHSLQDKLVPGPHITFLFFLVTIDTNPNLILLMTVGPPSQSDIFNSYVNRALRPSPSAKGISLQVRISGCKKSYSEMKSIFQHPSNLTPKWASCLPWKLRGSQAKPHTDHQGSQQGGPTHRPDKHPCDILNIVSFF